MLKYGLICNTSQSAFVVSVNVAQKGGIREQLAELALFPGRSSS